MSALEALEATVQGDSERLSGSGLGPLHAALTGFLATGKTRLFLRNVAERGAALVAGQCRDLQLGRLALDGGPHPSQLLTAFAVRTAELDKERRSTADMITSRIESGLAGLLTERSPEWQASLKELLDPCIEHAIHAGAAGSAPDRLKTAQKRLEEAGRGISASWLERRAGEVLELLTAWWPTRSASCSRGPAHRACWELRSPAWLAAITAEGQAAGRLMMCPAWQCSLPNGWSRCRCHGGSAEAGRRRC